jgi:DNA-binding response OmpR family regulator
VDHRPQAPLRQERILVVDDEADIREMLADVLSGVGYQVDKAASGDQALAKLGSHSYDLMLLDLRMPEVDGLEVMKQVQESHSALSVIVLTAYASLESAIAAVKAGASDYLLKPVSIQDVENSVARALQRCQERRRERQLIDVIARAAESLRANHGPGVEVPPKSSQRFLQCGCVRLDVETGAVAIASAGDRKSLDGQLTASETALLAYLMQHPEIALTYCELAEEALGYSVNEKEAKKIVCPHISRLRRKIEFNPSNPRIVRTMPGKGYRFSIC